MFQLPQEFAQEMIDHALAETPNECCGIIAGFGGKPVKAYRGNNAPKSPFRYNLDPKDLFRIHKEMEEKGWELLGSYHSHTHTHAYPSPTDVELAFWPEALYFIVSLEDRHKPVIRAFRILEGKIQEEELLITPSPPKG